VNGLSMRAAMNGVIALLFQSPRLVAAVAEVGSLTDSAFGALMRVELGTMKTKQIIKSTFKVALVWLCQAVAAPGQNLLVNGDFEAGNTGFTSDYTFGRTDTTYTGQDYYNVVRNPRDSHALGASFADHTTGTGFMLVANGAADTNRVVWRQWVRVSMNITYEFSGWATSWGDDGTGHDPNPAKFRVIINGRAIGPAFQLSNQDGQWQGFSVRWSSRESETALIELRLETTDWLGNDPAFDDLQFSVASPRATIRLANVEICWPSVADVMYQVEYESEVTGHLWMPLGTQVAGTGATNCVVDAFTTPRRFYRVREVP